MYNILDSGVRENMFPKAGFVEGDSVILRASSAPAEKKLGREAVARHIDTLVRTTGEAGRTHRHA
jgi:hypothetical protein